MVAEYKEKNSMFCLDPHDNKQLYGAFAFTGHRSLVFMYRPCIPAQLTDENRHLVDSECIADYNDSTSLEAKKKESLPSFDDFNHRCPRVTQTGQVKSRVQQIPGIPGFDSLIPRICFYINKYIFSNNIIVRFLQLPLFPFFVSLDDDLSF